ncbi:hypothetical protein BDD12DRAFT_869561 [Trichophaea hybrida]|nr:hypothetical protein BDD12DRAFT_869561 [Trichophaea hybrida]
MYVSTNTHFSSSHPPSAARRLAFYPSQDPTSGHQHTANHNSTSTERHESQTPRPRDLVADLAHS